mmetsp:Transcript_102698/g.165458  ORF Transcript_102698/g.165458 Transcript_102698/m.165458 type:complete len:364 (-) Transcript_102698:230-1321(-)
MTLIKSFHLFALIGRHHIVENSRRILYHIHRHACQQVDRYAICTFCHDRIHCQPENHIPPSGNVNPKKLHLYNALFLGVVDLCFHINVVEEVVIEDFHVSQPCRHIKNKLGGGLINDRTEHALSVALQRPEVETHVRDRILAKWHPLDEQVAHLTEGDGLHQVAVFDIRHATESFLRACTVVGRGLSPSAQHGGNVGAAHIRHVLDFSDGGVAVVARLVRLERKKVLVRVPRYLHHVLVGVLVVGHVDHMAQLVKERLRHRFHHSEPGQRHLETCAGLVVFGVHAHSTDHAGGAQVVNGRHGLLAEIEPHLFRLAAVGHVLEDWGVVEVEHARRDALIDEHVQRRGANPRLLLAGFERTAPVQ